MPEMQYQAGFKGCEGKKYRGGNVRAKRLGVRR